MGGLAASEDALNVERLCLLPVSRLPEQRVVVHRARWSSNSDRTKNTTTYSATVAHGVARLWR